MRPRIGQPRQAAVAQIRATVTFIPIIQGGEGQLDVSGNSILIHVTYMLILHPIYGLKKLKLGII